MQWKACGFKIIKGAHIIKTQTVRQDALLFLVSLVHTFVIEKWLF